MQTCKITSIDQVELENKDILILPGMVNYFYITENDQAREAVDIIANSVKSRNDLLAVDVETNGLDPYTSDIILLQIGTSDNMQYLFDMRKIDGDIIKPLLMLDCWKLGHNIKFDAGFIKVKFRISLTRLFDTFIAEKILRGGEAFGSEGYGLDQVVLRRLGRELKVVSNTISSQETVGKVDRVKKIMQGSFIDMKDTQELTKAQLAYAAQDVSQSVLFDLASWQTKQLKIEEPNTLYDPNVLSVTDPEVLEEYHSVFPQKISLWNTAALEFKFIEVVVDIETMGIGFSKETHNEVLRNIKQDYEDYRKEFLKLLAKKVPQKTLFGTAGINPDSNVQVLEALSKIGLNLTDTGSNTLDACLRELDENEYSAKVLKCLLNYRGVSKLVQAFGEKLSKHVHPITNRIHYSIQQILDTGRMSTKEPNLQQIPKEIDWKLTGDPLKDAAIKVRPGLRECFQAKPGHRFVIYDYAAQELRVAAAITLDDVMLTAFIDKKDPHSYSATLMYDESYEEFVEKLESGDHDTKTKRKYAKTVSFGALYGSAAPNLANVLHISLEKAQDIINRFWDTYVRLHEAMIRYGEEANRYGYSNTVLGRRRYYTDLLQRIKWIQADKNPESIHKKVEELKMFWLLRNGAITQDSMQFAKKAIVNRYRSEIARKAANHHIQGTSADMTKLAAIYIRKDLLSKNFDANIVGIVHDEIIVEASLECVEDVNKIVESRMKQALNTFCPNVPAEASGNISLHWKK